MSTAPRQNQSALSKEETADVIVIGAGLSGLVAARRLQEAGKHVVVLEARDRVGGRLFTTEIGDHRFDVGGQFFGPSQTAVRALADELGLKFQTTYTQGESVFETSNGVTHTTTQLLQEAAATTKKLDALAREVGTDAPWSTKRAAYLDSQTVGSWAHEQGISATQKALVDIATRAVLGAEPEETSLLYWAYYVAQGDSMGMLASTEGGAQAEWMVGGAQQLPLRLAEMLKDIVRLSCPVTAITQHESGVLVETETASFTAGHAIIALPPHMADEIAFNPPLPSARQELQKRGQFGNYIKIIVRYARPFWRTQGLNGAASSSLGPICSTLDESPNDGTGALLGFIGGDDARKWLTHSPAEGQQMVLEQLARLFGPEALMPTEFHAQDWVADPWMRGGPVLVLPPALLSRAGAALREPCGRIYWAGTEAAAKWTGYMDGAVRAGEAAAKQLLDDQYESGGTGGFVPVVPASMRFFCDDYGFSPAVRSGNNLIISGQLGVNADLTVPAELEAEVRQAFERIGMILQHAGAGFENIVELQSFHMSDNMSVDNQVFIRVRAEFIPGPHPAWTSYGIRSLALPDARVEIKALAVLPNY